MMVMMLTSMDRAVTGCWARFHVLYVPSERRQTHKAASPECISVRSWERQGRAGGSKQLGWGTEEFGVTAPFRVS